MFPQTESGRFTAEANILIKASQMKRQKSNTGIPQNIKKRSRQGLIPCFFPDKAKWKLWSYMKGCRDIQTSALFLVSKANRFRIWKSPHLWKTKLQITFLLFVVTLFLFFWQVSGPSYTLSASASWPISGPGLRLMSFHSTRVQMQPELQLPSLSSL